MEENRIWTKYVGVPACQRRRGIKPKYYDFKIMFRNFIAQRIDLFNKIDLLALSLHQGKKKLKFLMFKCQTIEKIQIKKREREEILLYLCTRDINNIVYFSVSVMYIHMLSFPIPLGR